MRARRESGVVLVVVLVFALLLSSTVATFLRKATIDAMIARNRDAGAQAEALARGGIQLGWALLLADRLVDSQAQAEGSGAMATTEDLWARLSGQEFPTSSGGSVTLFVEDVGSKLNLNAVFQFDESGNPHANATPLLEALLEKVIDELPIPPGEKLYDVAEIAASLIDWVDADELRQRGGSEDDYYQRQTPRYRAANQPLLSLDELRLVEGIDAKLVEGLRPYLTVHPYAGESGINPNTAPPHVLALLFFDDGVDLTLAREDTVRAILEVRQEGGMLCPEGQSGEACTPIGDIVRNEIYPPPSFQADVFRVAAEARVGEVRRRVEAVIDRSQGPEPLLLSWRVE